MSGPSPSSGSSLGSGPLYHAQGMPSSANSFGSLPSWFPQSHTHSSGPSPGAAYPFADSRTRIRLDAYPLLTGAEEEATVEATVAREEKVAPRKASTSTNGSGKGATISRGKDRDGLGTSSTKSTARRVSKEALHSPQSAEDKEANDEEEGKKKGKKRRRVVVACDTCRRKKVKCEGLPNATNTCDNCQNFGYSCAFTVEPDRSRGRYEILEAQKDTILAALRIVAPDLAEQFDRGELSASSLNGVKAEREQSSSVDATTAEMLKSEQDQRSGGRGAEEASSSHQPGEHDSFVLPRDSKRDLGPMIPDLEDGRPRYFGGSSNLTSFHHLDSRPSSPGPTHRHKHPAMSTPDAAHGRDVASTATQSPAKTASSEVPSGSRLSVLPRPRPQYPSNSVGWVRHVRKKTLVAVGRDDLYGSEGWFQRFHFPEPQLLNELLDLFFHQLNPLLPIIHEHSLRKDLSQGRADKDSAFRGLVFTILAISSRFLRDDLRVREDPSDPDTAGDYFSAASRFHHQVYAASLINVQVLLLTTTFMPSTFGVGTSWTVLGVAIRALQDIGLHTEKAYVEYTPLEQELRRRAFWAAFILDCIISINMGRPTALRLADTSVKFPLLASEEALTKAEAGGPIEEQTPFDLRPCPAAGFIHLIKLNIIAQDVVNTLYSPRWKPDFISKKTSVVHSMAAASSQQRSHPATYKDMTILCKRLDEWVAEMPSHLQNIRTSPYKLQAGLLQCGRHDLRLYILKPFLQDGKPSFPPSGVSGTPREDGSILKKMLLPQCASHARECLKMLSLLCDEGQLSHMVFVMQQAFLSAATFMLTVWHGTKDIAVLSKDRDLIEATLSMLRPEENRFCSALLRRAQRILCNIAQRALAGMPDEAQRHRVQFLIDLHGIVTLGGDGSKLFASSTASKDGAHLSHRQNFDEARRASKATVEAQPSWNKGSVRWSNNTQQGVPLNDEKGTTMTNAATTPALAAEYPNPSIAIESKVNTPSREHNNTDELAAFDQWIPIESSFTSALQNEPGEIPASFEFTSDLAWTDYFSRFLGGLPSPMAQSMSMSPMVNQTP